MIMPEITYSQTLPKNDPQWQLVFEDEFDSLGLNTTKWNQNDWRIGLFSFYNTSLFRCDTVKSHRTLGNNNLLFDTIGTGKLTIHTKRDTVSVWSRNKCDTTEGYHTFYYTTPAWLKSNDHFKYGYFEIRCKLPYITTDSSSFGIGPNFWLYENPPEVCDTIICYSEIDIFEFVNADSLILDSPFTDNHTYTYNSHFRNCINSTMSSAPIPNVNKDTMIFTNYHTFAISWTSTEIKYYKDDILMFTSYNHPDSMVSLSIILDVNLPTQFRNPISYTKLPYDYDIDYVKVWQPRAKCDSIISCNFSDTNYDNTKVKNISIGGSGCTAGVSSSGNVELKASEYIELSEGFTVEPGGEISIETEDCFTPILLRDTCNNRQPAVDEIPDYLLKKFFYKREE